ncbi:MAG: winged helix-turn-helix transcriptional regulator [Candidatus Lokiarchaeota archaeon]|nr:winged helix-turn-helix transcriptional regulator [Candidatus Lokiarchaeota archaeon]
MIFINISRQKQIKTMICSIEKCKDSNDFFNNLRELGNNLKNNEVIKKQLKFLNILANQERLMIIYALKEKDRCVCELEAILDKSQPSISHHLKKLEEADLIKGWKKRKFTYYKLDKKVFKYVLNDCIAYLDSD